MQGTQNKDKDKVHWHIETPSSYISYPLEKYPMAEPEFEPGIFSSADNDVISEPSNRIVNFQNYNIVFVFCVCFDGVVIAAQCTATY